MTPSVSKFIGAIGISVSLFASNVFVQETTSEFEAVTTALNNYLNGSSYNRPNQIRSAFYPESDMFLYHDKQPIYRISPDKYAALFEKRDRNVFNGRYGKILDIDVSGNIATAKAEIVMPKINARFFDIFLLKKLGGEWKIISKAADRTTSERTGEKFLLIVSESSPPLSDVIKIYEKAAMAGYTIDVAAAAAPVTFKKIKMSNPEHKAYLYDSDFMHAFKNPLTLNTVTASDYVAAKALGTKRKKTHAKIANLLGSICDKSEKGEDELCAN